MMPSCITSNPFNHNEIFYGTGESRANSADLVSDGVPNGQGVFKSTDRGKTFKQLSSSVGVAGFEGIWDIEHSYSDSNTIFVGTNANGLYRSSDNGGSWTAVFTGGNKLVNDVLCLPSGRVLCSQQGNTVYYSDSNGKPGTFAAVTFPSKPLGGSYRRIQLANNRKFPNVVYALFEGYNFSDNCVAFYKSSDGGKTWKLKTTPTQIGASYQSYCLMLGVSTTDTNKIAAGGVNSAYSTNGGASWTQMFGDHSDHHSFVSYKSGTEFLMGTDGGLWKGKWGSSSVTGTLNNGYNVTQFYAGDYGLSGIDAMAGAQDNGTTRVTGPKISDKVFGGDGAYCQISKLDGGTAYVSYQNEGINRVDNFNNPANYSFVDISDSRFTSDGVSFINAYTMNPADDNNLFYRTNLGVYQSTDAGYNWTKINTITRSSIKALACSNDANPVFYYGGGAAQLYKFENATTAKPGTEVNYNASCPSIVTNDFINAITINPKNKYQVFISFGNYSTQGRVWKVSNLDSAKPVWENISGDLPPGLPVNMVAVDPADPVNHIFAATDYGFYYTENGGLNWIKDTRIPNCPLHEIKIRNTDRQLFVFTHGRGMWTITLTPIKQGGVKNVTSNINFNVYPNPAKDQIQLQIDNQVIAKQALVFDLNGKLIFTRGICNDELLDVSQLKPGFYFLQIQTNKGNVTKKINVIK